MTTGFETFDKTVQLTNEMLGKIEKEFGWEDRRNQSYTILRALLHNLRDRLPIKQIANFSTQLPMLVRGVFFESWSGEILPDKISREEFVQNIREEFIFSTERSLEEIIAGVFSILTDAMAEGEREEVLGNLPEDLRGLLEG